MGARLVLLVCVSLAIAAWPVGMSPEEINPAELAILAAAFATVLAAQCGLLWLAGRFAGDRVADGLMALLIAANAHHFAFLTLEARTLVRVSLALAVGLGAWMALRAGITRARVLLFTLVFTTLSLGQYAYGRITLSEAERKITSAPGAIPVKSNRNVYLISTESLHSPYAFRRLYGIENAPHVAYLKAEGFRVFDRAYSVETTTRLAYQCGFRRSRSAIPI